MTQTMKNILISILSYAVFLFLSACGNDHHHEGGEHGDEHGNGHPHEPQHGGVLIPCGDHQYNLEIVHDHHSGDLEIYVQDGHAKNPVQIKQTSIEVKISGQEQPIVLQAVDDPTNDKTVGNTDYFKAEGAPPDVEEFEGTVTSVTIKGITYSDKSFHYKEDEDHDH